MRVALRRDVWAVFAREDGTHALGLASASAASFVAPLPGPPARGQGLAVAAGLLACASQMEDGVRVDLITPVGRALAHVLLDGASAASLRLSDDVLVVADDRGRVLALDVLTGSLTRDLRVRL